MAQQTIGLGTVANDGTGDNLRAAGGKINANFTELYTAVAAVPETARDTLAAALVAGSGVTITPNDATDTITIAASGGGGGAASRIGYVSGRYYLPPYVGGISTLTISAGRLYAQAIEVRKDITLAALAYRTAGTVAHNARLAVYADDNGKPGALIAQTTITAGPAATNTDQDAALSTALPAGAYWLAFIADAAAVIQGYSSSDRVLSQYFGGSSFNQASNNIASLYAATDPGTGLTLPNPFGAVTFSAGAGPTVAIKIA